VKAILLAAGYATRLYPLTENRPKVLLPIGGRPMLDWIADKVDEVEAVDGLHVVTNAKFAGQLERWADAREGRLAAVVHDDGTRTNETRLGALGDVGFVIERAGLDDDLLVVAGDNLFEFRLDDLVGFWRTKGAPSAVALYDCGDLELARQYAVVSLDPDGRIVEFVEKPAAPAGTLIATAAYVYSREHARLLDVYIQDGNPPDAPGNFLAWLHRREPVYGRLVGGGWFDVGDRGQLLVADNRWRERVGLEPRERYEVEPAHI
jgi:glucose-1-phosphate thymidylyltransferase